jgi:hypothetical protein
MRALCPPFPSRVCFLQQDASAAGDAVLAQGLLGGFGEGNLAGGFDAALLAGLGIFDGSDQQLEQLLMSMAGMDSLGRLGGVGLTGAAGMAASGVGFANAGAANPAGMGGIGSLGVDSLAGTGEEFGLAGTDP